MNNNNDDNGNNDYTIDNALMSGTLPLLALSCFSPAFSTAAIAALVEIFSCARGYNGLQPLQFHVIMFHW